jgi:hypothetical protein
MRLYREHSRSSSVRFTDRGRPNRLHGKAQLQNSGPEARRLLETCGGLFPQYPKEARKLNGMSR